MAKTTKTQIKKKEKQYFNDLLLPIIFTICILPFTVRLKEYDYGYGEYAWHSPESVMQDLYTYYRMWLFIIIISLAAIVLIFRMALYKEKNKNIKVFIPLFVYLGFVMLSSVFSINPKAAWLGNFVDLEGFFVLAGYVLIAFYTYQIMETERDYAAVFRGMQISFAAMSIVGWMQVFKKDPVLFPAVQKLIMSEDYFEYYEGQIYNVFTGNNVSLSLYNPNFAVIYLIMFSCVFAMSAIFTKERKTRIISSILLADALILTWFTYSRAGLVALFIVAVLGVGIYMNKKQAGNKLKTIAKVAGVATLVVIGFVAIDILAFGGKYMNRLFDEKKDNQLKSILTTNEGVEIHYGEQSFLLQIEGAEGKEELCVFDSNQNLNATLCNAEDSYFLPIGTECEIAFFEWNGRNCIFVTLYDNLLTFTKEEDGYTYVTTWGKEDKMVEIDHVDANGLEYLGSGRVYIWTRILPLLKKYIFVGSGPDTFAEVYPQNDYAGKLVYAENPARIMERAHNDYLMKWVQTGLLSLVALLVFYIFILKKGFFYFKKENWECSMKNVLALGCLLGCVAYMICGLFSDSTLYTSPTFYVFIGIVLSVVGHKTNA